MAQYMAPSSHRPRPYLCFSMVHHAKYCYAVCDATLCYAVSEHAAFPVYRYKPAETISKSPRAAFVSASVGRLSSLSELNRSRCSVMLDQLTKKKGEKRCRGNVVLWI